MHGPRSFGVIVCRSEKKKRYRRRFAGAAATCSYIIWSYIWSHQPCHGGSSCRYTLRPIQPLIGRGPELGPVWQRRLTDHHAIPARRVVRPVDGWTTPGPRPAGPAESSSGAVTVRASARTVSRIARRQCRRRTAGAQCIQ
jgi:hypothetical protein